MVYCGNEKPLWYCKNAMNNVKYKCIYAICNDCFTKKGNKKRKRQGIINDEFVCDHKYLDFFAESGYFKADFIITRKSRGDIFPTECVDCKRIFTDVKTTGTV